MQQRIPIWSSILPRSSRSRPRSSSSSLPHLRRSIRRGDDWPRSRHDRGTIPRRASGFGSAAPVKFPGHVIVARGCGERRRGGERGVAPWRGVRCLVGLRRPYCPYRLPARPVEERQSVRGDRRGWNRNFGCVVDGRRRVFASVSTQCVYEISRSSGRSSSYLWLLWREERERSSLQGESTFQDRAGEGRGRGGGGGSMVDRGERW